MAVPGLTRIATELDRLGIRYIVVGGAAVAQQHPVSTEDVDIIVTAESYSATLAALDKSPLVKWGEQSPGMATVQFRLEGREHELDVIDAAPFSGDLEDDAFV